MADAISISSESESISGQDSEIQDSLPWGYYDTNTQDGVGEEGKLKLLHKLQQELHGKGYGASRTKRLGPLPCAGIQFMACMEVDAGECYGFLRCRVGPARNQTGKWQAITSLSSPFLKQLIDELLDQRQRLADAANITPRQDMHPIGRALLRNEKTVVYVNVHTSDKVWYVLKSASFSPPLFLI
eukprot:TRINITY_DN2678_c0_g3_i1.p1 TRINITY_DN2678_c0_g3~~TRINITY_DN2678_c0_g3_i1.p1  ORF type:complete len:185 (-),score=22.29 TRINITY_DN2678_c0_g3_i1:486-1040(-)